MSIQFSAAKAIITENLGGAPAVLDEGSLVNLAGRALFNARTWNFLVKGPVDLATTASSDEVDLPADFGGLVALVGPTSRPVEFVSAERFALLQAGEIAWPGGGYAAMLDGDDSGFEVVGTRLRLHPAPSNTASDAFKLVYTKAWAELSSDSSYVQIPVWLEPVFIEYLTEVARGYDEDDIQSLSTRLIPIRAGVLFSDAVHQDGQTRMVPRQLSNGIGQWSESSRWNRNQAEWPGG